MRTRGWMAWDWMIRHFPVTPLAATGGATLFVTAFQLENQLFPLLMGAAQVAAAAAIGWERLQRA